MGLNVIDVVKSVLHVGRKHAQAEVKDGDTCVREWFRRDPDPDRKRVNEDIYHYGRSTVTGSPETVSRFRAMLDNRMRVLYGDRYDELVKDRVDNDPRVAELLIWDTIRTGMWEELPDELQPIWHGDPWADGDPVWEEPSDPLIMADYAAKYGADWHKYYDADLEERRRHWEEYLQRRVNMTIWERSAFFPNDGFGKKVLARIRFLYGDEDGWDGRYPKDPSVGKILIADAIRTGEWWLLPKELQAVYHIRAGDVP